MAGFVYVNQDGMCVPSSDPYVFFSRTLLLFCDWEKVTHGVKTFVVKALFGLARAIHQRCRMTLGSGRFISVFNNTHSIFYFFFVSLPYSLAFTSSSLTGALNILQSEESDAIIHSAALFSEDRPAGTEALINYRTGQLTNTVPAQNTSALQIKR